MKKLRFYNLAAVRTGQRLVNTYRRFVFNPASHKSNPAKALKGPYCLVNGTHFKEPCYN